MPVIGGASFEHLAASGQHTCGVSTSGPTYCWGYNQHGQAGDGTTTVARQSPVMTAGGLGIESLTAGTLHSCGVTHTGQAYCWGYNFDGQLGDGSATNRSEPSPVSGALTMQLLAAGYYYTCGLTVSGLAYCWGRNNEGQLGDGMSAGRTDPGAVSGALAFLSIAAGSAHSCAITPAGEAYCWGSNTNGQLGRGFSGGALTQTGRPAPVAGGLAFRNMAGGLSHTCGITTSGQAYCWGRNIEGQLGDGTTVQRTTPTAVAGGLTFTGIAAGHNHTCGITVAGDVYCWGDNRWGQLGDATTLNRSSPVRVQVNFAANRNWDSTYEPTWMSQR